MPREGKRRQWRSFRERGQIFREGWRGWGGQSGKAGGTGSWHRRPRGQNVAPHYSHSGSQLSQPAEGDTGEGLEADKG